jgi:hypothetical protein
LVLDEENPEDLFVDLWDQIKDKPNTKKLCEELLDESFRFEKIKNSKGHFYLPVYNE